MHFARPYNVLARMLAMRRGPRRSCREPAAGAAPRSGAGAGPGRRLGVALAGLLLCAPVAGEEISVQCVSNDEATTLQITQILITELGAYPRLTVKTGAADLRLRLAVATIPGSNGVGDVSALAMAFLLTKAGAAGEQVLGFSNVVARIGTLEESVREELATVLTEFRD